MHGLCQCLAMSVISPRSLSHSFMSRFALSLFPVFRCIRLLSPVSLCTALQLRLPDTGPPGLGGAAPLSAGSVEEFTAEELAVLEEAVGKYTDPVADDFAWEEESAVYPVDPDSVGPEDTVRPALIITTVHQLALDALSLSPLSLAVCRCLSSCQSRYWCMGC